MADTLLGYNIGIRLKDGAAEKVFVGTTANTFSINPEIKESITKDDAGFKRSVKTGYGYEFSIEALSNIKESGETTILDRNDIIDLTLALGANGEFDFWYGPIAPGSKVKTGTAIITGFSENTDSENEATISVNCTGVSDLEDQTLAAS